MEKIMMT